MTKRSIQDTIYDIVYDIQCTMYDIHYIESFRVSPVTIKIVTSASGMFRSIDLHFFFWYLNNFHLRKKKRLKKKGRPNKKVKKKEHRP